MNYDEEHDGPVMIAAMFAQCAGGCGAVVRVDARFCDECVALHRQLEARRIATAARNRSYGVGEYALHDMGVMAHGEATDLPTMLTNAGARERFHVALTLLGFVIVIGCTAATFAMGCVGIWRLFFAR